MDEQYVYRLLNTKTGEFFRSGNGYSIWMSLSGAMTTKNYAKKWGNDSLVIKKYRLVEVE